VQLAAVTEKWRRGAVRPWLLQRNNVPPANLPRKLKENRRLLHDRYLLRTRVGSEFLCAAAINPNDPKLGPLVSTAPGVNENRNNV
jgi:hypothetical protein